MTKRPFQHPKGLLAYAKYVRLDLYKPEKLTNNVTCLGALNNLQIYKLGSGNLMFCVYRKMTIISFF